MYFPQQHPAQVQLAHYLLCSHTICIWHQIGFVVITYVYSIHASSAAVYINDMKYKQQTNIIVQDIVCVIIPTQCASRSCAQTFKTAVPLMGTISTSTLCCKKMFMPASELVFLVVYRSIMDP